MSLDNHLQGIFNIRKLGQSSLSPIQNSKSSHADKNSIR